MAAGLQERDIQVGLSQAWHNATTIKDPVTRQDAHPFEVVQCRIQAIREDTNQILDLDGNKILIASDDNKPVGLPYQESYVPNSIANFWKTIDMGLDGTPYQVVSAGSTENRCKIFASIRITDGFTVGERLFKDFINVQDSFDKSMSFKILYSAVCVVCSNTFEASLRSGETVGQLKHSKGFDANIERMVAALDLFAGTSARFKALLTQVNDVPTDEQEARAWITGVNFSSQPKLSLTDLQKTARMTELFRHGKGNAGATRLDAFQGVTEFHTHESATRGRDEGSQWNTSEFGSSRIIKTRALEALDDWENTRDKGITLLTRAGALISN